MASGTVRRRDSRRPEPTSSQRSPPPAASPSPAEWRHQRRSHGASTGSRSASRPSGHPGARPSASATMLGANARVHRRPAQPLRPRGPARRRPHRSGSGSASPELPVERRRAHQTRRPSSAASARLASRRGIVALESVLRRWRQPTHRGATPRRQAVRGCPAHRRSREHGHEEHERLHSGIRSTMARYAATRSRPGASSRQRRHVSRAPALSPAKCRARPSCTRASIQSGRVGEDGVQLVARLERVARLHQEPREPKPQVEEAGPELRGAPILTHRVLHRPGLGVEFAEAAHARWRGARRSARRDRPRRDRPIHAPPQRRWRHRPRARAP